MWWARCPDGPLTAGRAPTMIGEHRSNDPWGPAVTTIENRYLAGNFGPVAEETTAFDLPVTGRLPEALDGRYLRNGPNPVAPRRRGPAPLVRRHRHGARHPPARRPGRVVPQPLRAGRPGRGHARAPPGGGPARRRVRRRLAEHQRDRRGRHHARHRGGRRLPDGADRRARLGALPRPERHVGRHVQRPPEGRPGHGRAVRRGLHAVVRQRDLVPGAVARPARHPRHPHRRRRPDHAARRRRHRDPHRHLRPARHAQRRRARRRLPAALPLGPRPRAPRRRAAPPRHGRPGRVVRREPLLRVPPDERLRPARRSDRARRVPPPEDVRHRPERPVGGPAGAGALDDRPGRRQGPRGTARRVVAGVPPRRRARGGPPPPVRLRGLVRHHRPRDDGAHEVGPRRRHQRDPRLRPRPLVG